MIRGIGIDIIEIHRIEKAVMKKGFLERYFTIKELLFFEQHQMNPQKIAGNFCAKEAIVKMFGTGFRTIRLCDIEILRDNFGKPTVYLYQRAMEISSAMKIDYIHVSISNTAEYASAVAIGERL